MIIRIHQINPERDTENRKFEQYEGNIDLDIYDEVFMGRVNANDLEDVWNEFNIRSYEGQYLAGHSLSVSDIVDVLEGTDQVEKGKYYCDCIGWKKLNEFVWIGGKLWEK